MVFKPPYPRPGDGRGRPAQSSRPWRGCYEVSGAHHVPDGGLARIGNSASGTHCAAWRCASASVSARLRIREGLPYLIPTSSKAVSIGMGGVGAGLEALHTRTIANFGDNLVLLF